MTCFIIKSTLSDLFFFHIYTNFTNKTNNQILKKVKVTTIVGERGGSTLVEQW